MENSKERKSRHAHHSRFNVDGSSKGAPIPLAIQSNQHPYSAYAFLSAAVVFVVVAYLLYANGLKHYAHVPITAQTNTLAPTADTTGSTKPIEPVTPVAPDQSTSGSSTVTPSTP